MRQLKLVFRRRGAWSTLAFAAVVPLGSACGGDTDSDDSETAQGGSGATGTGGQHDGTGGTATGGSATGGTATGGTGPAGAGTGGAATAGTAGYAWSEDTSTTEVPAAYPYALTDVPSEQCVYGGAAMFTAVVPLPPEGTPALAEPLCNTDPETTVDSGWAARVTLQTSEADPLRATGTITIAPELAGSVVGLPRVRITDIESLREPTFGEVAAAQDTFTFDVTWPADPDRRMGTPRLVIETRFTIGCGAGETREVRALTALYFCSDDGVASGWASSGDRCLVCASVCEMAASPILPSDANERMALRNAVRLRLRVLGQVHGALVLLAEHNGGAGRFDYQWQATGGRLVWVDRDVALWTPPESATGTELVQVAAMARDAAAVASLRYSRAT